MSETTGGSKVAAVVLGIAVLAPLVIVAGPLGAIGGVIFVAFLAVIDHSISKGS